MALTKEEVEAEIAAIDAQIAAIEATEAAYATGAIDDGKTGGPPTSPTAAEFLVTSTKQKETLQAQKTELETIRDTQDFSLYTGE